MSSNQENLNNWYQSLSSAIRKQNSKQTPIYQRDELCRRPLRSAADSHNTPANAASRKRNMLTAEISELPQEPPVEQEYSAPKRMKPSDASELSAETSSCVIL